MMKGLIPIAAAILALLTGAMLVTAGWDFPPVDSNQSGFRGTGMVVISDRETNAELAALNQLEEPFPIEPGGPRASTVYENVPVLGHLTEDEFLGLMGMITEWVSPEQGCDYCHNPDNLASDEVYTKIVTRRMLEMTQHINSEWQSHVADTGVTCYTCHRGQPVPEYVWSLNPGPATARGMTASREGQNVVGENVGLTSLHTDPFTPLLGADGDVGGVEGPTALPTGHNVSIQQTERTYALMQHVSGSLGVNCTFCHNTRAFSDWSGSNPQKVTAWHGIRMVRDINGNYITPLEPIFPDNRLGPEGDALKANCATCHQGVNKPLMGAKMAKDYPMLTEKR